MATIKRPTKTEGRLWERWVHYKNHVPGAGRNTNGMCRCGSVRAIHEWDFERDPFMDREEWGGMYEGCDLYEFAVHVPGDWHSRTYGARTFVIPNGTRVEYVGPAAKFRRDGEQFGVVDDPGDERSDEFKFGEGSYKAYYVRFDSGKIQHVAHCDLKVVNDQR